MWGTRQGLIMVLLTMLAAAAWWLLEGRPEPSGPTESRARTPDYVVDDLDAVETDAEGHPSRLLMVQQLRQYVDEDLAELDLPRLTIVQPDAPPWLAESRHGLLLAGGDEVHLSDHVRVHRTADEDSRAVALTTSELTIWPKKEYAQGDQPVRIDSDRDWLTGEGIKLWYSKPEHAEIVGRARIYIAPPANQGRPIEEPDK